MRRFLVLLLALVAVAPAWAAPDAATSHQLYHISGSKASFDRLMKSGLRQTGALDVWRVRQHASKPHKLQADVYARPADMAKVLRRQDDQRFAQGLLKGVVHKRAQWHFKLEGTTSEEDAVARDRREVAACRNRTQGQWNDPKDGTPYVESAFFDCFRPADEVYTFFDALAKANPTLITKVHNVSTTYEKRCIDAYKISVGDHNEDKKVLYTQALIHAREWQAGAATFYVMAGLLDGLRRHDPRITKIFSEFDWVFVPIVNIDGYEYTWKENRYWRLNRHPVNGYDGVDLNRNFGPFEFFNLEPDTVDEETNPGPQPYSEPETEGIFHFITSLENLYGMVDMHSYGGLVLRPFSDVQQEPKEPKEPYGSAIEKLGDKVAQAMTYESHPGSYLYNAYGCFDDGMYRHFNFTIPAITIEVEGDDFISPQSTIRKVGADNLRGFEQFAQETLRYAKKTAQQRCTA